MKNIKLYDEMIVLHSKYRQTLRVLEQRIYEFATELRGILNMMYNFEVIMSEGCAILYNVHDDWTEAQKSKLREFADALGVPSLLALSKSHEELWKL